MNLYRDTVCIFYICTNFVAKTLRNSTRMRQLENIFFSLIAAEQQAAIVSRMRKLESLAAINNVRCIQFQPKVSSDLYYIKIQNGSGCSSHVSRMHIIFCLLFFYRWSFIF